MSVRRALSCLASLAMTTEALGNLGNLEESS